MPCYRHLSLPALALFCLASITAQAEPVVVLAAGDIGQCGRPGAARTAALISREPQASILALGDLAYPSGRPQDFERCYAPHWGAFQSRTYPVPGNHEYVTPQATAYFEYFGERVGQPGRSWYAFDLGHWRAIALDSNLKEPAATEQLNWLRHELAASPQACVLAYWHHPRFSSGLHGDNAHMAEVWQVLAQAGASLALTGHDHAYERYQPLDGEGRPDPSRGLRGFVVGTGGAKLYPVRTHQDERSEAWFDADWAVLRLLLDDGAYRWSLLDTEGRLRDQGEGRCVARRR